MFIFYMLFYETGCSTGYRELVGVYSSPKRAKEAMERDIRNPKNNLRSELEYHIRPIEIDTETNYIFYSW